MSEVQSSTFACRFCEVEDEPELLKEHLLDEHAVEIAGQHWATHIQPVRSGQEGA